MKKLTWITHGQYTRSVEGRFLIVDYPRTSSAYAQPLAEHISLNDQVQRNEYSFKTLKEAKAFCQDKLNTELERLNQPYRAL